MSYIETVNASDINLIAAFLAHQQVPDLASSPPVDCIVICVSAVLRGAEVLFRVLERRPELTKVLVLCGGIGHSTQLIYDVVERSPRYRPLAAEVAGLPEARVLKEILEKFYDVSKITSAGCRILIEDKSTNCGANAIKTREILVEAGISAPKTCIIIQDPTMALRTTLSFEKAFEDLEAPPKFLSCPVFIPQIKRVEDDLVYTVTDVPNTELWETKRFLDLIMGEIPRVRDDKNGYGPKGHGFIPHIDLPEEVEAAWQKMENCIHGRR